jgi:outer membrane protein
MRRILSLFITLIALPSFAQTEDSWTLQQAVKYAIDHNLSIKQSVLNERLSRLTYLQSITSQLPNINGSGSRGRSFGRSVDPTTNSSLVIPVTISLV